MFARVVASITIFGILLGALIFGSNAIPPDHLPVLAEFQYSVLFALAIVGASLITYYLFKEIWKK